MKNLKIVLKSASHDPCTHNLRGTSGDLRGTCGDLRGTCGEPAGTCGEGPFSSPFCCKSHENRKFACQTLFFNKKTKKNTKNDAATCPARFFTKFQQISRKSRKLGDSRNSEPKTSSLGRWRKIGGVDIRKIGLFCTMGRLSLSGRCFATYNSHT